MNILTFSAEWSVSRASVHMDTCGRTSAGWKWREIW